MYTVTGMLHTYPLQLQEAAAKATPQGPGGLVPSTLSSWVNAVPLNKEA